jgi:hypothetical protein
MPMGKLLFQITGAHDLIAMLDDPEMKCTSNE